MLIPMYNLLRLKFPDLVFEHMCTVAINEMGEEYIKSWEIDTIPQPTKEELMSFQNDPDIQIAYQIYLNTEINYPVLEKLKEIDLQSIRSLREGNTDKLQQYTAQAVELRKQLLPMTAEKIGAIK